MRQNLRSADVAVRATLVAMALLAVAPRPAAAGFFDFLFGNDKPARSSAPAGQQSTATDFFGNPIDPGPSAIAPVSSGRYAAYCVRTCDGKYFPLTSHGGMTPAQTCQSFCPASATKVYSGGGIDNAVTASGERYADLPNAFAYRKALKADCTCNGRDPAGLAPIDLSLDTTLRPGDIVATSNGLVAYSGVVTATGQTAEFTPVANYPGLTADLRAKLGEMKVTPVKADISLDDSEARLETTGSIGSLPAAEPLPAPAPIVSAPKAKKADAAPKNSGGWPHH